MFWTLTAATNLLTLCKRLDLHFVFSFRFMRRRVLRLKLEIMVSHQKVSGSSMVNLLSGKASGESVAQTLSQSVYVSPSFQKQLITAFP